MGNCLKNTYSSHLLKWGLINSHHGYYMRNLRSYLGNTPLPLKQTQVPKSLWQKCNNGSFTKFFHQAN